MSVLADRLLAVHDALDRAEIPHAFGGAIALAYCTQEPRGTRDIDVNVFVGTDDADRVLDALPRGAIVARRERTTARREGQVRIMWDETPLDVFFDTDEFHKEVARAVVDVPFENTTIPVLGCQALIVFKAMFGRSRDWADIEEILDARKKNVGADALGALAGIMGESDPAVVRLTELLNR